MARNNLPLVSRGDDHRGLLTQPRRPGVGRWLRQGVVAAVESSGIMPWVCYLLKELK